MHMEGLDCFGLNRTRIGFHLRRTVMKYAVSIVLSFTGVLFAMNEVKYKQVGLVPEFLLW